MITELNQTSRSIYRGMCHKTMIIKQNQRRRSVDSGMCHETMKVVFSNQGKQIKLFKTGVK